MPSQEREGNPSVAMAAWLSTHGKVDPFTKEGRRIVRISAPLGSYSSNCNANDRPREELVNSLLPASSKMLPGLNSWDVVRDHVVWVGLGVCELEGATRVRVIVGDPTGVTVTAEETLGVAHPDG